ncbi:MAG: hypothetical protein JWM11_3579 [Planctomycetaceae bacterium]|nr:hypothetical protein [Planctomycetaceae bacterium]
MLPRSTARTLFLCGFLFLAALSARAEEKPVPATELTPAVVEQEALDGFVPLFNGKNMTGWVGNTKGYYADGKGNIVCDPKKEGGNVYTEKEYSNFVLRFQFKLTPGANNGLGIRAPLEGDAAYVGMELQILDDTSEKYKGIQPWQRHGSIYGIAAARTGFLNPVGEWNSEEVIADGRHITVKLNGVTIVDVEDLDTVKTAHPRDQHPGLKNVKGHIGFLGHGDPLQFRALRIKELPANKAAAK